jgi:hypothetical protein
VNPVFSTNAFWIPYFTLEADEMSEEDFAAQLDSLRQDYLVHEETISFEYSGSEHTAVRRFVDFSFSCGERFSLLIEYEPAVSGCVRNLFLLDAHSGTKHEMGWWDLARWHPYCLRREELDSLLQFWGRCDPRWPEPEVSLLLLCQFVGLSDSGVRETLAVRTRAALQALGFSMEGENQLDVPLHVADGNYRWEVDVELGWTFTSEEYCCYSIRNRPHADSGEGRFPFLAFQEMMSQVQQWLEQN